MCKRWIISLVSLFFGLVHFVDSKELLCLSLYATLLLYIPSFLSLLPLLPTASHSRCPFSLSVYSYFLVLYITTWFFPSTCVVYIS